MDRDEKLDSARLTWAIDHPYQFKEIYNWLRCWPNETQAKFREKIDEAMNPKTPSDR